jgi:hypothetical protein
VGDQVADVPIGEDVGTEEGHELAGLRVIGIRVDAGLAVGVTDVAGGVKQLSTSDPVAAVEACVLSRLVGARG